MPSALNPSPQVVGASIIHDESGSTRRQLRSGGKDVNNPVFSNDIDSPYNVASKSMLDKINFKSILFISNCNLILVTLIDNLFTDTRQISLYNRHKVAPLPVPPSLSATSNIPNIGGLVQNMNDLSARMNLDTVSQNSSNYSGDPPDSLIPVWPANDSSRHVKKLSWNDDDRVTIFN